MTADNDIDGIFEKHSVKEIENLLSKMRNDIERKKEDLRIMVGERYRDLIEAADTIADMRESADAICGNVLTVERLCESLQQRGLIGFKTRVTHHSFGSRDPPPTSPQYSLAIQVKLLVDVPEILWGLAERRQYLDATQLFLLAQQAHTALQLSPNASEMLDKFPVISRQWSSISQFRSTITRGCISLVRDEVEDLQLVLEAVAATVLLEGKDATEALRATLQLRRDALATCLQRHDVTPSAVAMRTLPAFVTLCVAFLRVVDYVFSPGTNGEKCRLEKLLMAVSGEATEGQDPPEPPINLLYESSLGLSFLPKAVVEFRPKLRGNLGSLSATFIHEEMKQWMASAVPQSSKAVGKLLSCTTSMKALSLVRGAVWEAHPSESDQRDWNLVTERVLGSRGFSPWETVVRQEALARARILLKKELEKVCENVLKMVKELAKEIKTNARACSEEGNVSEFIWSESMSDLPDQVAWASMGPRNAVGPGTHEKMGLFYKSRGYTRRIQTVCKALNSKMTAILEDVSCYAPDSLREDVSPTDEGFGESAGASEDYDALLQFLQQETVHVFKGFLVDLEAIAADGLSSLEVGFETEDRAGSMPPVGLPPSPGGTVIVTASRLSQAIPLVCPQLKICAGATLLSSKDTARRVSLGMQPDTQSWVDLVQHFHQNSSSLMATFLSRLARIYVAQTKAEFTECFRKNDPESLLRLFASWDKVQIEEESETGSKVESSISIPAHPSPPLSAALANIGSSLNAVCAHTVTRKAQGELVTSLTDEVLSMFEEVTPAESGQWPSQAVALQFLFDLKLIQNMLLPREQKEMGSRMVTLIHLVEGAIDPFDLDVFSPHLSARVKMASQRLLVLLGPVIPRGKQPYTARGTTWSSGGNNTLPIVPSLEIPRFSNVPLAPSPHPRKPSLLDDLADPLLESHLKGVDHSSSTHSLTSSRGMATAAAFSASRSAASLFSAVSSSWFGGNS